MAVRTGIGLAISLLHCSFVQASGHLASDEDFFADIPMVISATRLAQPISETPTSTTIIDRETIEASGMLEIADVLRLVPGFQVGLHSRDNNIAVTYHGQADAFPRRMQVLIDGRSVYGAVFSSINWHTLGVHLEDIERIEVIRNPNAPVYGANAFIATINIITKQVFVNQGTTLQAVAGSNNTRNGYLRYAASDDKIDYRASVAYDQNEGFDHVDDAKRFRSAQFHGEYTINPSERITLDAGIHYGPLGRGGDNNIGDPQQEKDLNAHHQLIRWNHILKNGGETYIQFYHNFHREQDDVTIGLLSDTLEISPEDIPVLFPGQTDQIIKTGLYDYTGERYDLEIQYSSPHAQKFRYVVGGSFRHDSFESRLLLGQSDAVDNTSGRIFANGQYKFNGKWLLHLGAMVENSDLVGTDFSPRIALNYKVKSNHTLRASITRAFRNPSLIEEHFNYGFRLNDGTLLDVIHFSEGDLIPEEMTAYELSYIGEWFNSKMLVDFKLFREELREEIEEVKDGNVEEPLNFINRGAWVRANSGSTNINGFEMGINYRIKPGSLLRLNYSYADADVNPHRKATRGRYNNSGTPMHTASMLVAHSFDHNIAASLGFYHVTAMAWYGDGDDVPQYNRTDVRLAKKFPFKHSTGKIEFIAQNLGDDYTDFRELNTFETQYFVRASWQFH